MCHRFGLAVLCLAIAVSVPLCAVQPTPDRSIIPEGFRAVAVRVKNDKDTLAFILPGSKVDVIGTLN